MVVLWAKGDPDGLAIAMNESLAATPELAKTLLWDRNARWADQLKARMDEPGTVFVAVGAGHLAGERSVQDYLKARGLTVERVEYCGDPRIHPATPGAGVAAFRRAFSCCDVRPAGT